MSNRRRLRPLRLGALAAALLTVATVGPAGEPDRAGTEILWDTYGVPHIFATTREEMFYAHGWAQAQGQANLLLRLYGESRGRAAEYWGPEYAALDRWLALNQVPERAKEWYDAQSPTFRRYWDEFARGINDYAAKNRSKIDPAVLVVLPLTGVDVVGHSLRVVHYGYMATAGRVQNEANAFARSQSGEQASAAGWSVLAQQPVIEGVEPEAMNGSNTWTVGPSRSASGNSMLVINPHLAWGDTFYRYMEVHQVGPDYDLYGAPQVGFPVAVVGFNRHTGWGRTVNTLDTVDFFKITVANGKYMFDGQARDFERASKTIRIKQPDGSFTQETIEIRKTVHGPVVYDQNGLVIAMRVAGIDRPRMMEQWFKMGEAANLTQFQDALRIGAVPMWNANYADDQGHIMLVDNGLIARRNGGTYQSWGGVQPGDKSDNLWKDYLSFEELPKSLDPPAGFNQNTNEPPWTATIPPLDPSKYPAWVAPGDQAQPTMRTLRSLHMMVEDSKISYEMLIAKKHSTRMELADRVLPDLLEAGRSGTPAAQQAAAALGVLAAWDRNTDINSRGAVLFQAFANAYLNQGLAGKMRVKYDPKDPVGSAYGLADPQAALAALATAAEQVQQTYGSLDIQWGDVYRFKAGNADVPGNGGAGNSGLFRTITFSNRVGNKYYAAHGETIVCAVEFGRQQQARCTLSYGNSSQPGSPHQEDQLPLMVAKALHPVWRERAQVEANLESRDTFTATSSAPGGR